MRRLELVQYGAVAECARFADVAEPEVGKSDVLIEVAAASINPIDYKFVSGALRRIMPVTLPAPFGFDCSGIVRAVGSDVSTFAIGDKVFARAPRQRMGAFAESISIDSTYVAHAPESVSFSGAASLPLVALTTIQGLVDRAQGRAGQSILIHAGSGGLGSFAIQYAKHVLKMHVTATTSSRNCDWVAALGADKVIAYDVDDYKKQGIRYDVVFDTLGGKTTSDSFAVLKRGGSVVSVAGPPDRWFARQVGARGLVPVVMFFMGMPARVRAWFKAAHYFRFLTESNGKQLQEVADLVDGGIIKPIIDKEFAFDQAIAALEYVQAGRAKGKVIIRIGSF